MSNKCASAKSRISKRKRLNSDSRLSKHLPKLNETQVSEQVLSDITGKTGLAIIRAILAGEHDPRQLATLRDERCAKTEAEIVKALTGNYRTEHLFALKQAVALYDMYTTQIQECDPEPERLGQSRRPARD